MSKIKEVIRYQTTDYTLHSSMKSAEYHQAEIDKAEKANTMLDDGKSIGDILKAVGMSPCDDILHRVTKNSKLVISHWQCMDTPGYQPIRFETGMKMRVYGNDGSWSGPYGNTISTADIAGYAKDKRSKL